MPQRRIIMNGTIVVSLYDLLSTQMTADEIRDIDMSPEFILKCCKKSPGVLDARYLGEGNFELDSTAGVINFKVETTAQNEHSEQYIP
jgi:hypothetical protein